MQTEEWGPPLWDSLHTITFNSTSVISPSMKSNYISYFSTLRSMLPCKYCRHSYTVFTHYLPIEDYVATREELTYWLYWIHTMVNFKLRKQNKRYWEVICHYETRRVACEERSPTKKQASHVEQKLLPSISAKVGNMISDLTQHGGNYEELALSLGYT